MNAWTKRPSVVRVHPRPSAASHLDFAVAEAARWRTLALCALVALALVVALLIERTFCG